MESTVIKKQTVTKLAFQALFVILLMAFSILETRAAICSVGGDGGGCCHDILKKGKIFRRTFMALQVGAITQTPQLSLTKGSLQTLNNEAPVITFEDINDAYKNENNLIYYTSPDDESFSMNLGIVDLENPQHWILPECKFIEEKATGIAVQGTPYMSEFADATHCKQFTYNEDGEIYEFYEYYKLNQSGATLLGSGDDFDDKAFIEHDNLLLTPFPLDKNFKLSLKDTIITGTRKKITEQDIVVEGYGILTTSWGDVEVLKIVNNYREWFYIDNELTSEDSAPVIQFISKSGHQCELDLAENSPTTGDVTVEWMDFTQITTTDMTTGIDDKINYCVSSKLFTPNPSSGIIKFNTIGNYKIYNLKGTKVRTLINTHQADLSDLPKGTYLIKSSKESSQKLILH